VNHLESWIDDAHMFALVVDMLAQVCRLRRFVVQQKLQQVLVWLHKNSKVNKC